MLVRDWLCAGNRGGVAVTDAPGGQTGTKES